MGRDATLEGLAHDAGLYLERINALELRQDFHPPEDIVEIVLPVRKG